MNKGISYIGLAQITLGIIIGVVGCINLQARPESSFEMASAYLEAPFYVDSKESARWGD